MAGQNQRSRSERRRIRTFFLDRDGVINCKLPTDRWVRSWEEFAFIAGVPEALAEIHSHGMRAVVVTNQRGVARGVLSEEALEEIHRRMCSEVAAAGGEIDAVYCCPHEGGCECRKPSSGLLKRAAAELRLDLGESVMIGDRLSDIEAGNAVGSATSFVPSDIDDGGARALADYVARDLRDAVRWVVLQPLSQSGNGAR